MFSVSEITRRIKAVLEGEVGRVWIEGELSNVRQPASGHLYFTIKDANSQIAAVMFRGQQFWLRFRPQDGTLVQAYGDVSVYERNGQYQIIVREMREGGTGSLQAAFEALKKKLAAEGLFEAARKRALPLLPRHIGVVTSPTGAAIRDILNVIARRFPNVRVTLAPARVQGEGAADEVAAAIDLLNARAEADVLIVGRGGGSLEDLWCFNEEVVARAIARSSIPVVSAVGHETDFTISDFVADLRAPTPSAAAELVVDRKDAFEELLRQQGRRLGMALRERLLEARARLAAASGSYVFREPGNIVQRMAQRLDGLTMRMQHAGEQRVGEARRTLKDADRSMDHAIRDAVGRRAQDLRRFEAQLRAMSPLAVLKRGYSITLRSDGRAVRAPGDVRAGERIRTRVAEGEFESTVAEEHERKETE